MPPSPPLFFFLRPPPLNLPLSLSFAFSAWHRWANPADVLSGCLFFVCVRFLLSVFSLLLLFLTFAHLSCCRMDLGWEVNEVICICPKLFAVDCFEGRTTGEKREKKPLTAGEMYKNRAKRRKQNLTASLNCCLLTTSLIKNHQNHQARILSSWQTFIESEEFSFSKSFLLIFILRNVLVFFGKYELFKGLFQNMFMCSCVSVILKVRALLSWRV